MQKTKQKIKNEISHKKLDLDSACSYISGRYTPIGTKRYTMLVDKVIFPINVCPHCGSRATFHKRIQENNDVVGNVWRVEQVEDSNGSVYKKFDYCFDCYKEFLIELYIWKNVEVRIKK